jgi:hypothetical protein
VLSTQLKKFLGFLEVLSQWPFNEDVLPGFDGGDDGGVVAVDANGTDDKIDVLVAGKVF